MLKTLDVDPITLELVNNSLQSLSDEMGFTIARTCASALVREAQDFAAGFTDSTGEVLSNCITAPAYVAAPKIFIKAVKDSFQADIKLGDIFVVNDSYHGGTHLPDIQLVKPVFADGMLICWMYTKAHHVDVGGRVPGSMAFDNVDIFQDGFRIPPVKIYQGGVPNRTFFDLLKLNVRYPDILLSDLNAKIGAMTVGEDGIRKMILEYGRQPLLDVFAGLLDYSEGLARAQIGSWEKGSWEFEGRLDEGIVVGRSLKIHVTLTLNEDGIHADFTGTSEQVAASCNMAYQELMGRLVLVVRSSLDGQVPMNGGIIRMLSVYAPEGTLVHPKPPGATSERGIVSELVSTVLLGAMVQCRPEKMTAAGHGGSPLIRIGGKDANGHEAYMFDIVGPGAVGARMLKDGLNGITKGAIEPVEILEAHFPVRIENFELVPDTGGPGQFRGGYALRRDYVWLGTDGFVRPRIPCLTNAPWGMAGGSPGSTASLVLNPGDDSATPLNPKDMTHLKTGDVVSVVLASGGGWGDPRKRDPQLCLEDFNNGLESIQHLRDTYGVVISEASNAVDIDATWQLRRQMG
jgi:N-methylhydantoinase B